MNWSKAKTILIIFFICTNLFLLTTIIVSTGKNSIVTDDIISSTISILENNRIEIDVGLIPRRTPAVTKVYARNFIDDYEGFAKRFVGELTTPVKNNTYSGEKGVISFVGDKFEFLPAEPMYEALTAKINSDNAQYTALEVMKKYGFDDDNLIFKEREEDGVYVISITKQKDGLYYFNSELKVTMTQSGVTGISGSWFYDETVKEKIILKSVTSILIDYISLSNRPTTTEKIVALDLGYSLLEGGIYHKEITLIPCWRITLDTDGEYILKASESYPDD